MKGHREEMRVDELLSAYIDGALTPGERARLEARLAAEPALRERLDALQETVMLLRQLPQVPAPRNFILTPAMVRPAQPSPARQPLRWLAPALSMATAASALLLVIVLATSLLGVREAAPTAAMLGPQGGAAQVAEMPAPEESPLPEAAAPLPSAPEEYNAMVGVAESAVTDTAAVTLPVRIALATPPATEEAEVQMLLAPEEAPEEGGRGFVEPLPTETPMFALPAEAPAVPWLPLGGLGLLTLALGLASAWAWRSRRG